MIVASWDSFVAGSVPAAERAATIGVFDGLHRGHRVLLERIVSFDGGLEPTVFTFRESPKAILRPNDFEGDIFSLDQKLHELEKLGAATVVLIDFSGDFGKLSGKEFVDLIKDRGRLRYLAVGSDFRCGYRLDTDARKIRSMNADSGIPTDIVKPVLWDGAPVSSSRIRSAIAAGNLVEATALLGRNFVLDLASAPKTPGPDAVEYDVRPTRRITPPNGRYPVLVKPDDRQPAVGCEAAIDRGRIRLPSRIDVARYVEFIL